ncbi:MAG TPA: hypothetical protein PKU78_02070 [Candidatus Dojkabacteria bacterium]|nr:hypothetical protein [Candidatus Dojkabacteria bacterium]HRO64983.1 hypothetical protein [Candidatus Dojkabacteria bacterium]HRP51808.1 hypothetical protein [Candidatus Dojkabacteria bacterium]
MNKKIAIDIDDTLLDTQSIFCDVFENFFNRELDYNSCKSITGKFLDSGLVNKDETNLVIKSEEYLNKMFSMPVFPGVYESIHDLMKEGVEVVYVSSRDNLTNFELRTKTIKWLRDNNLYFNNEIEFTRKKGTYLKGKKIPLLIDDAPIFAEQAKNYNIVTIMPIKPWNKNYTSEYVHKVLAWEDIPSLVYENLGMK